MWTLLQKELREQWRTHRFLVVGAVLLLFGLLSPVIAKYTPDLIKALGGSQLAGLENLFPTPTVRDAIQQYVKNLSQLGVVMALLVPMGAVVQERDRGTAAMLLSKPVSLGAFLTAKFVAIGIVFLCAIALAALGGYYYTGILFQWLDVGRFASLNGLFLLDLLAYMSLTLLASTLARSLVAAGGIAFASYMVLWIAGSIPAIGKYLPDALLGWGSRLALGLPGDPSWAALGVTVGIIVAALAGAWAIFRGQEI